MQAQKLLFVLLLMALFMVGMGVEAVSAETYTWSAEYFNNSWFTEPPTFTRQDSDIDFNWAYDGPFADGPTDEFSVRWTTTILSHGNFYYDFFIGVDDEVKLFVNGVEQLHLSSPDQMNLKVPLWSGENEIVVEFKEHFYWAYIDVDITPTNEQVALLGPPPLETDYWIGEYFNNADFLGPAVAYESFYSPGSFDREWGWDNPDGITREQFSARFRHKFNVPTAGRYTFEALADDRMVVVVDNILILDAQVPWNSEKRSMDLAAGEHEIIVSYVELGGYAKADFKFYPETDTTKPKIYSFSANQSFATPTDTVTLSWSVSGADDVVLFFESHINPLMFVSDLANEGSFAIPMSVMCDNDGVIDFRLTAINRQSGEEVSQRISISAPVGDWFFTFADGSHPGDDPCSAPINSNAAQQRFQYGTMIWIEALDSIYVMYDEALNSWDVFADSFDENATASGNDFIPPPGLYVPVRGFGNLWANNDYVRNKLGFGLAPEEGYQTTYQKVERQAGIRSWGNVYVVSADNTLFDLDIVGYVTGPADRWQEVPYRDVR